MFFIMGVSPKQEELDFNQTTICYHCGKYGEYKVTKEYMVLSLFFIPVLKWNKKFYVKTTCCGSIYSIDKGLEERISKGENVAVHDKDLKLVHMGKNYYKKRCSNCSFKTNEDFQYCPRCAFPFK